MGGIVNWHYQRGREKETWSEVRGKKFVKIGFQRIKEVKIDLDYIDYHRVEDSCRNMGLRIHIHNGQMPKNKTQNDESLNLRIILRSMKKSNVEWC